jgi:glycerophosphoryl diester phosphodiesterase
MRVKQIFYTVSFLLINNVFAVFSNNFIIAGKPQILKNNVVEVYGHRGARSFAPENSIIGYQTALKIGVNWVDMDVGVSKDGQVIVYHDMWINPDFTSKRGKFLANSNKEFIEKMGQNKDILIEPYLIKNLTYKEIELYDVGILNPNSPYKTYFKNQYMVPGTKIPLVQDVINYIDSISNKEVNYQIEIKNDPTRPKYM